MRIFCSKPINVFATGMMGRSAERKDEVFQLRQGVDGGNHFVDNIFDGETG
jgi:hypothetical protein